MADTQDSGLDVVKTGSGKSAGVANESVLQQMEELYARKLAERNSFLSSLADASAWWSGGVAGPTQGLAQRAEVREKQDKELLGLQSDIANKRVTLNMLRDAMGSMVPPGGATTPTAGASGAPAPSIGGTNVAGGAVSTEGGPMPDGSQRVTGGAPLPAGWGMYQGVPVPPEYYATIRTALSHGDLASADKAFKEYSAVKAKAELESMYNLDQYTPITTTIMVQGKPTTVTLLKGEMRTYQLTGKLPSFIQTGPNEAVTKEAVNASKKAPAPAAPAPATPAPAPAAPAQDVPFVPKNKKIDAFSSITNPAPEARPVSMASAPREEPSTIANLADKALTFLSGSSSAQAAEPFPKEKQLPAVVVTPNKQTSKPTLYGVEERGRQQQADIERQKEQVQSELKATQKEREEAGAYISKIQQQAKRADEVKRAATQIINHATEKPEEYGYHKQTDVPGWIVGATHEVPILGPTVEGIREKLQGADAAERRNISDSNALKLGIDYAVKEFTGTGTRTGAELFRRAAEAKGVGVNQTAKSNIYNAMLIGVEYAKAADQAKAWQEYSSRVEKTGAVPNPYEFLNSPANLAIEAKWKRYLNDNLPTEVGSDKSRKPLESLIKRKEK